MATITVSHEMASKYPEFRGRFGETVEAREFQEAHAKLLKEGREEAAGGYDEQDDEDEAESSQQSGDAGKTDGDASKTATAPKPATAPRRRATAGARKPSAKK